MLFRRYKSWQFAAVCMIALVVFALISLASIGKFSLWHDESFTHMLVGDSPANMIRRTSYDVHPPLYYILLKIWASVFGYSVVALRSFSLLTMLVAMGIMMIFTWRKYGRGAAAITAILLAVNPALLRYSQEMRMYGLVMLLVISSTWAFVGLLNKPNWTRKVIYGLSVSGLIYTQYFAVLIVFGHVLYWLHSKSVVKHLKSSGLRKTLRYIFRDKSVWQSYIIAGAAFSPWLPILVMQADKTQGGFWIGQASHRSVLNFFTTTFGMKQEWGIQSWSATLMILMIAMSSRLIFLAYKKHKSELTLPLFVALAPIVLLYVLSMPPVQPYFHERYLIIVVPYIILLVAIASARLIAIKRNMVLILLSVIVAVGLNGVRVASKLGSSFGWSDKEYFSSKSLSEWSDAEYKPGDTILASSLWVYFDARYYQQIERGRFVYLKDTGINKYGNNSLVYDRADVKLSEEQINNLTGRIWVYDESKPMLQIPANWMRLDCLNQGYGSLTLYSTN